MNYPTDPRPDRDIEARLRDSLREHARRAPEGASLAEQIIATAGRPPAIAPPRTRRTRTWTVPLLAAAAVAAVAGSILAVTGLPHHSSGTKPPPLAGGSHSPAPRTSPVVTPTSPSGTTGVDNINVRVIGLTGFRVVDTTFVGPDDGWALGTANCLVGAGTCVGMVHTTDGKTWDSVANPPVNLAGVTAGCLTDCAAHIRFANDSIGYVFGPSALFMTTDGGKTWQRQAGGAYALETLENNVIRVSSACLPGCPFTVQTASIGSPVWQSDALPGGQAAQNSGVALARTGARAFVEIYGHVAGGAPDARSVLYASTDDGVSWARLGEPCPQSGRDAAGAALAGEVDSTAITTASDGSVTVLCTPRRAGAAQYTATSTDAGATFHPGAFGALGSAPVNAIGAASARILIVAAGDTFRSADGGASFARIGADGHPTPGDAIWLGFENGTVGRAVSGGGSTIWTTRDAGETWTSYTFP